MKKKVLGLIISFFLFSLSVPQICFAELGAFFEKQDDPAISCSAMKAVSLLDISKKVVKMNYENAKDFFFTAYFDNFSDQNIPVICGSSERGIISLSSVTAWNSRTGEKGKYSGSYCLQFDDHRLRGRPPGKNNGVLTEKIYLLSLEALHKGSIPAGGITLNFYNI